MLPLITYFCPECGLPFTIVWTGAIDSRQRTLIQCPRWDGPSQCPGMVEAAVTPDAQVVVTPPVPA